MKADLPLAVRRRMEEDRQREIRAALVRRYAIVCHEREAIDAALLHHALKELPRVVALIDNGKPTRAALTVPAVPAVTAPPALSPDNLRTVLGLT